jgi:hypothetical protein
VVVGVQSILGVLWKTENRKWVVACISWVEVNEWGLARMCTRLISSPVTHLPLSKSELRAVTAIYRCLVKKKKKIDMKIVAKQNLHFDTSVI